jgi:4,5-dihydroxyphthalate decarboxylase
LSLSSFTVKTAQGNCPYVGVPAFVSRAFRHTSIYVRTDRIKQPADLKGKKVGVPEYQLTANVWARAMLEDDHGVRPSDIHWIRGGLEEAGRPEKIAITLPKDVKLEDAPAGRTLSGMLETGEIDAFIGPRVPSCFERGHPNVGWLFPDPVAAAKDYFKRTGMFPIMHLVGVRREIVDKHPWLPVAVLKAFERSKAIALEKLADTSSAKVTLPFVEEQVMAARQLMGRDFWPYGVAANRKTLETFLRHHHAQGLSSRLVTVEELFHPTTFESFKL